MAKQVLTTAQGETLAGTPWEAYPRPQMKRDTWQNLNGIWGFAVSREKSLPESYDRTILVPFAPESQLSGIGEHFPEGSFLCYRREFAADTAKKGRFLLHFGAVSQYAEIYVNQSLMGTHQGGYETFSLDITDYLRENNELVVRVKSDLDDPTMPYGKNVKNPGGMWYTPVTGIWQTVWAEWVPQQHIKNLDIQVTLHSAAITVTPALDGQVNVEGKEYPLVAGKAVIEPETIHLWSPEDPYLYRFTVTAGDDKVDSYFALRTLDIQEVKGIPRLCLNGKPYFFHGLLDQGYWPDGLLTPASPECYAQDIFSMKELGFNTLRKHIKGEPEQFYYDCDRLGMVVFQDMVNNGKYDFLRDTVLPTFFRQRKDDRKMHRDAKTRKAFLDGLEATVRQLKNHPSICYWTIFNEGWGQFDATAAYKKLKTLDSSRFIDSASGWFRGCQSDVESLHIYFGCWFRMKKFPKPIVLSEFGGFAHSVAGHIYNPDKTYGYGTCKTLRELNEKMRELYEKHVIPQVKNGLCAAIYTQVSDVEDEINGLVTYDRKVTKAEKETMLSISHALQKEME